jgi:hypothetical protein
MFYVGVPNTRYDEISGNIAGNIVMISIVGLVIMGVLSFVLIRSITGPLSRVIEGLRNGAEKVAAAASQVPPPVRTWPKAHPIRRCPWKKRHPPWKRCPPRRDRTPTTRTRENDDVGRQADRGQGQCAHE